MKSSAFYEGRAGLTAMYFLWSVQRSTLEEAKVLAEYPP